MINLKNFDTKLFKVDKKFILFIITDLLHWIHYNKKN